MKTNYSLICDQHDDRWESSPIGDSSLTIGRAGCVICSLCTLLARTGYKITPDALSRALLFEDKGSVRWNSLDLLNTPLKFRWLETQKPWKIFHRLTNGYRYGRELAVVRVVSPTGNFDFHWMAVMGIHKNSIVVADSFTNEFISISRSQITGAAFFHVQYYYSKN
jgi:hypothetical protein